jgi:4-carboxymuconolactone decarboxylase
LQLFVHVVSPDLLAPADGCNAVALGRATPRYKVGTAARRGTGPGAIRRCTVTFHADIAKPTAAMPMTDDPFAHLLDKGNEMWAEVMGSLPAPTAPVGSLDDLALKLVFGGLWSRPGLSIRDRRLINLTLLAVLGRDDITPFHVRAALESGDVDAAQLEELGVQLAFYTGWPVASSFLLLARREVQKLAAEASDAAGDSPQDAE